MNVNELNNDGEAPEGVAADGAAAAVAVAEANAEADALAEEINAAARHYDARFLEQERQVLHIALIRCGIRHGDARERFMDGQGIGPVMSLAWMTKKDIEKMVEYHNSTLTNTIAHRPLRLGLMHARRVYALAYHVTQLQAQGKLFRLEDWSMEKADELLQRIALQEDTKSMDPPTLGNRSKPVSTGMIGRKSGLHIPLAFRAFSERTAALRMSGVGIVLILWLHSRVTWSTTSMRTGWKVWPLRRTTTPTLFTFNQRFRTRRMRYGSVGLNRSMMGVEQS